MEGLTRLGGESGWALECEVNNQRDIVGEE